MFLLSGRDDIWIDIFLFAEPSTIPWVRQQLQVPWRRWSWCSRCSYHWCSAQFKCWLHERGWRWWFVRVKRSQGCPSCFQRPLLSFRCFFFSVLYTIKSSFHCDSSSSKFVEKNWNFDLLCGDDAVARVYASKSRGLTPSIDYRALFFNLDSDINIIVCVHGARKEVISCLAHNIGVVAEGTSGDAFSNQPETHAQPHRVCVFSVEWAQRTLGEYSSILVCSPLVLYRANIPGYSIRFAPARIPRKRRFQMLAVAIWSVLIVLTAVLFFLLWYVVNIYFLGRLDAEGWMFWFWLFSHIILQLDPIPDPNQIEKRVPSSSFPPLWPFLAAYQIWVLWIDQSPEHGGRIAPWFRRWRFWNYFADYYPASWVSLLLSRASPPSDE